MEINVNGVSITLTADQLKQINEQVKKQEKESAMPTTWEECMQRHLDSNGNTYYANSDSIAKDTTGMEVDLRGNSCLSERRAKQIAAAIKLSVIVDTLNGGLWVPDIDGDEYWALTLDGEVCEDPMSAMFYLKSEKIAEHILEHFKDLLNDFFMLEN